MKYFSTMFINKATELLEEENLIWIQTLNSNSVLYCFVQLIIFRIFESDLNAVINQDKRR